MFEALAAGQVTLATVWLLGVSLGLTACTVTCLPFIGTWALGRASSQREALLHTGVFLAGRILTYTLLAALAGAAGEGLARALGGTWGNAAIGSASIFAGVWLLARPAGKRCRAVPPAPTIAPVRIHRQKADGLPPLFLGAALSLAPCTPLASLLALAAQAGSMAQGAAYGLAFGLGAAMTPILVLVPLAGRFGREIVTGRLWLARWLAWSAALVLIVLGVRRLLLSL
ncbi:MAG: sulfite exporter TauE/SafE family protein [Rhodocyclaceae bacterium]|nr:sulfite exporter TauE/SafE family protein [Rhodocyclaceae bacterium]